MSLGLTVEVDLKQLYRKCIYLSRTFIKNFLNEQSKLETHTTCYKQFIFLSINNQGQG